MKDTNQHKPMTKATARKLLGVPSDRQLALRLGLKPPSICNWGRMVPRKRIPEIVSLARGEPSTAEQSAKPTRYPF